MSDIHGPAVPFAIDPETGGVRMVSDRDKLAQNVRLILGTKMGERPLNRGFGTQLRALVQEPNDGSLGALLTRQVREALVQMEPRIVLADIVFRADGPGLTLDLTWFAAENPQPERLSIPLGGL
ncbi:GPW/gp25 family protein [Pseudochelatococcus sp. B33]